MDAISSLAARLGVELCSVGLQHSSWLLGALQREGSPRITPGSAALSIISNKVTKYYSVKYINGTLLFMNKLIDRLS